MQPWTGVSGWLQWCWLHGAGSWVKAKRKWGKAGRVDFQGPAGGVSVSHRRPPGGKRTELSEPYFWLSEICDRSPGGRDPFGNGLPLHAILRLWSKWTGIHWDTALWSEGQRESTAVRNLEVWGLAKESPRDSRCREQGVSRVDLQARWVFNDREE